MVGWLDEDSPKKRQTAWLLEQSLLPAGDQRGRIVLLVLEQMPEILARKSAKQPSTMARNHGQLEVDDTGAIARHADPVGLLGEVVVCNAAAMQSTQQAQRILEVGCCLESIEVHCGAGQVAACQSRAIEGIHDGYAADAAGAIQSRLLTPHESSRDPPESVRGRCRIAHDVSLRRARGEHDRAEGVAFQRFSFAGLRFVVRVHAIGRIDP